VLEIEYVDTDDLIPYTNNSRTHSESQIKQIVASIREFGFTNPVLIDEDQNIIAGHGRLIAAKQLDLKKVPTITLEGLTEAQRAAYVIADNKLALNADWDIDLLQKEIEFLKEIDFDTDLTGFSLSELQELTDFDFSDDNYTPEKEENYNEAIIQYVLIFDDEEQQARWNQFLMQLKADYPDLPTHSARISEYLFDKGI